MNLIEPENSAMSMASAIWDKRWERFKMALTQDGVEPRFQNYYRGWVLGWLRFIKPKRFQEVDRDDVTHFLAKLAEEGKKTWQGRQALEALQVFYQRVEPLDWAKHGFDFSVEEFFKESLRDTAAAEVVRPPMGGVQDFSGRGDEGELPAKYADFVAAVEEALRTHRYAYRTEQSSLDCRTGHGFLTFTTIDPVGPLTLASRPSDVGESPVRLRDGARLATFSFSLN